MAVSCFGASSSRGPDQVQQGRFHSVWLCLVCPEEDGTIPSKCPQARSCHADGWLFGRFHLHRLI